MLSGVKAVTKLKDFKVLKPEITQFLYQSPERPGMENAKPDRKDT